MATQRPDPGSVRPPVAARGDLARRLGARLVDVGYTEPNLRRLLGGPIRLGVRGLTEVARRRLDGDEPRLTLFRLFWLGVPVSSAAAEAALAPIAVGELADAGIVARDAATVTPVVAITPYAGFLLAHDRGRLASEQTADFVASVSPSSSLCDWLTIRRPVASALDLGTGCGVQALLAARHAQYVTALDVNARALDFAALNAALNGVVNVDFRRGRWFEPIAGERFDLLVANLPFVLSPDDTVLYRDGGLARDDVARHVLSAAPDHLAEGGFAHVFCNWIVRRGGDWREPLERWIGDRGCDAVLVLHGRYDPLTYAASWNHPLDEEDLPHFADTLDRWLAYYRGERIDEIGDGMVVLRQRSTGPNFVRGLELPETPAQPAGEHVSRLFTGYDVVRALREPADALDLALALPAGATVDVRWASAGGGLAAGGARIVLRDGAGFAVRTTNDMVEVLRRCDGRARLGALVAAVAGDLGRAEDALAADVAAEATRLVGLGFLVPADRAR